MSRQGHQLHESPCPWLLIGLLTGLSAFSGTALALGPVVDDDLRADSLCIDPFAYEGDYCAAAASDAEIRLEADTVRVRFLDSTAGNAEDGLGNSWALLANDYKGAGDDAQTYFGFTLRSLDPTPDDGRNNIVGEHMLRLGPSTSTNGSAGAVAIGNDSEFVEGVVSLGNGLFQRRLVHVAAAMQETDALIKRQLEEGLLGSVGEIADRLDELEGEVAALERQVAGSGDDGDTRSGGDGGGGITGAPILTFLAILLYAHWRRDTAAA